MCLGGNSCAHQREGKENIEEKERELVPSSALHLGVAPLLTCFVDAGLIVPLVSGRPDNVTLLVVSSLVLATNGSAGWVGW